MHPPPFSNHTFVHFTANSETDATMKFRCVIVDEGNTMVLCFPFTKITPAWVKILMTLHTSRDIIIVS